MNAKNNIIAGFLLGALFVLALAGCRGIPPPPENGEPFRFVIDGAVQASTPKLPGLDGGPERLVGVMADVTGRRDEFVVNEVVFRPASEDDLNTFLAQYGGTVLRDGTPMVIPEAGEPPPSALESSNWYLIRVDVNQSSLEDIAANMEAAGVRGLFTFSSETVARLAALVARENANKRNITVNVIFDFSVSEHPDDASGNLDAATWWWMTEDDDPGTSDIEGLSVGVVHAWQYLRYMGLPPTEGTWTPVKLAIIDNGFALDETTGVPLEGNIDYFYLGSKPFQADLIDRDGTAGGADEDEPFPFRWHGQNTFGVSAAKPFNLYGSAGTGGEVVRPMLYKVDSSGYVIADAIRSAAINGADVISISIAGPCNWFCSNLPGTFTDPFTRPHEWQSIPEYWQKAVLLAITYGAVVLAGSGNDGNDISDESILPCKLNGVICVGSVDENKMNLYNYGSGVDIWAPSCILSTVTPLSAAIDADDTGEDELSGGSNFPPGGFCGTSASVPLVAGVVGLMKVLNPDLHWDDVRTILQETANPSPDPKVAKGYVDAYRAVLRARENLPPTININIPSDGASVSHNRDVYLHADVSDPESGSGFKGEVVFSSDRDGELCRASGYVTGCKGPQLSLGTHVIRADASDLHEGTATDTISVSVINQTPIARITFPESGATFFADQSINFRGYGFDWDEDIPAANVSWSSDIDGPLATGEDIVVSLSEGLQTITLTATDSLGLLGDDSITVTIMAASGHPSALIISPAHNTMVSSGTSITLEGQGSDPEDGPLTGSGLVWTSNIDGTLGSGATLDIVLSGPAIVCNPDFVSHTITLQVEDSDGHQVTHSIVIRVGSIC